MPRNFDNQKWTEAIKYNDWYLRLSKDIKHLLNQAEQSNEKVSKEIKGEIYRFFEEHLEKGDIALSRSGPNWDEERKPIDTVVIHHTHNLPGITWQRLSAMHLVRIYLPFYASSKYEKNKYPKNQAIFSHHFRKNSQTFCAYHWLVRKDGSTERLLDDNEIGWHAGNWDINCRSIAVCLDNNFENSTPSGKIIRAVAILINEKYPQIKFNNIVGHREVNSNTICPGNKFLTGWKTKLTNTFMKTSM